MKYVDGRMDTQAKPTQYAFILCTMCKDKSEGKDIPVLNQAPRHEDILE
jgi:hypothetical protein